jgi:hypothetical protein
MLLGRDAIGSGRDPEVRGRRGMRKLASGVLCVAMLLVATPASARTVEVDRASARSKGGFASANVQGRVDDPRALFVKVTSNPTRQRIRVIWNVFCWRGQDSAARSGDFTSRTRIRRELPISLSNPDYCTFAATTVLEGGEGRHTVFLLAVV